MLVTSNSTLLVPLIQEWIWHWFQFNDHWPDVNLAVLSMAVAGFEKIHFVFVSPDHGIVLVMVKDIESKF